MEYYFEVSKIIEGGLRSDVDKVNAYAHKLASRLQESGDVQPSKAIFNLLDSALKDKSRQEHLISQSAKQPSQSFARPIPVERDSRFTLADKVSYPEGSVNLFLSTSQKGLVEQFISNFHARDKLLELGLPVNPSLLLYGLPGTGKSKMASYIASKLHLPLVTARSDALISSYLGSTAKNIRSLLEYAQSEPCVLFLDEFDAIAKARDDKNEIGELKRVVVSLLQNIDNLGETVLIAATNHPHLLDPAIWRRFHTKIELAKPSIEARELMIASLLSKLSITKKEIGQLGKYSKDLTGAEIEMAAHSYLRRVVVEGVKFDVFGLIREFLLHRFSWLDFNAEHRNESIAKLRSEDEALFSFRVLGKLFDMSESNARKIMKGMSSDE